MSAFSILSLGNWPTSQSYHQEYKISPLTKKIIKNIKIDLDKILPITYNQYILQNNLSKQQKTSNLSLYHQQLKRRSKKISILQSIWKNIKYMKSKSTNKYLQSCHKFKKQKQLKKQYHNIKNNSKSFYQPLHHLERQSKSPLLFTTKSPTKDQAYFDYYNKQSLKHIKKYTNYQQQSTKTRRQKTITHSKSNEHFHSRKSKKSAIHPHEQKLSSITLVTKKLSQLQHLHNKQLQSMNQLTDKQKKRLSKIHSIQKQKYKNQIIALKTSRKEHHKAKKYFL